MITLPPKFEEANNQSEKLRDVLVRVEDTTFFVEEITQDDWAANTGEDNVDYATQVGDVILAAGTSVSIVENYETGGTDWGAPSRAGETLAQEFKLDAPYNVTKISLYLKSSTSSTSALSVYTGLDASGPTGLLDTSDTVTFEVEGWYDFTFTTLEVGSATPYFMVWDVISGSGIDGWWGDVTGNYPNGNAWIYDVGSEEWQEYDNSPIVDTYFRVYGADIFKPAGFIKTDEMDLGQTPSDPGEWALSNIVPAGTALFFQAWASDTGAFAGEEDSLGTIVDGDSITNLKRYYKVNAIFNANFFRDKSPTLQAIKADFTSYKKFNMIPDLGYENVVESVSSLTSKIDLFKSSSIGKISVNIEMTDAISDWVYNDTLYNKIVRVKIGFKYSGLVETDYVHYFTGAIDDWSVGDGSLSLTLKDMSKEWKLPVPSKWETTGDDVTWTAEHHIDVMLDIFQNKINVRDSGLLLDGFATVKAATSGYKVTRTITEKTEDAKKLVEELRVLLFAYFIPRGDGKIGIKQFDSTETVVASFTDDNTISIKWKSNSKDLINSTSLYFNWSGSGSDEADFSEYDAGDDTTSQTKFKAIEPYSLKDKWTRTAEASQISGLETKILDQFDDMPSAVSITCDAKDIAYEVGDMVNVTTIEAPGANGEGITDQKYLLMSKNLDFLGDKIVYTGLQVAV